MALATYAVSWTEKQPPPYDGVDIRETRVVTRSEEDATLYVLREKGDRVVSVIGVMKELPRPRPTCGACGQEVA